jgi:hypothetical protein
MSRGEDFDGEAGQRQRAQTSFALGGVMALKPLPDRSEHLAVTDRVPMSALKSLHKRPRSSDSRRPVAINRVIGSTRSRVRHSSDARSRPSSAQLLGRQRSSTLQSSLRFDRLNVMYGVAAECIRHNRELQCASQARRHRPASTQPFGQCAPHTARQPPGNRRLFYSYSANPRPHFSQRSDCSISSSCLSRSVNSIARRRTWRATAARSCSSNARVHHHSRKRTLFETW